MFHLLEILTITELVIICTTLLITVISAFVTVHGMRLQKKHHKIIREASSALEMIRNVRSYVKDDQQALEWVIKTADTAVNEIEQLQDGKDNYA